MKFWQRLQAIYTTLCKHRPFPNRQAHKSPAVIKNNFCLSHGCCSMNTLVRACSMASILQLMMRCHLSDTLVDPEHLILLLVPICVRCFPFFRTAVLQDLKEHYFAGREDGSRLRSASGKHANRKRPWLSQSTSFRDGSEAWAGATTAEREFKGLTNETLVTGGLN